MKFPAHLTRRTLSLLPHLELDVAMWGPPAPAPQIILLHEGLGSIAEWRDFPQKLSEETGFGVVAYSREGYGHSTPLRRVDNLDYLHDEARHIPAILDCLGIEKAYLFGHSDGGSIAIITAALFPERILSIFVEAPHLYVEPETVKAVMAAGESWDKGPLKRALKRQHANPEPIFRRWHDLWISERFGHHFNILPELKRVVCTIIAVQGTLDEFASTKQLRDIQNFAAKGKTIWIENCGHAPHRQEPELIMSLARKLMSAGVKPTGEQITTRNRR
ncbi:alpha/beta hydrolase [Brucella sp. BE17]|uniref:alpha/beta fold hydrolase n=1 Tax=Brucella sp. BE17 TaxID=3142977 RepID=UPI0031BAB1A1